jgi:hypothetical protein
MIIGQITATAPGNTSLGRFLSILDTGHTFPYNYPDVKNATLGWYTMLYEIEVSGEGNSPLELNRVFDLLEEPRPISRVLTADFMGKDQWCDVTGWSEEGPCPAYAVLAEDSGDGVILLVYGGIEGIRLKSTDLDEDWDLDSNHQWGEPCLMLSKDTAYS